MFQDSRGVSNVLGVALLFAVVISGAAVVVTVGATALDDTRDGLDTSRAEKTLTQFDSRSAMVALGGTSHQNVELAAGSSAGYQVNEETGWMNVSYTDPLSGDTKGVVNTTLGEVAYENGNDRIAYQGGGVWRKTGPGSTMLSPPEFHFRDATLTLPIITVSGSPSLGSSATVEKGGPMTVRFPNASQDSDFVNPIGVGRVNVTVHSDYYEAWGRYFEQRTDGEVFYDHDNQTARIKLVVPFNEDFDNVVATTATAGITMNGNDPDPSPSEEAVDYPLADSRIEEEIDRCEQSPSPCDTSTDLDNINTDGTYYHDGDYEDEDLDVDTSDGNVTVIINGHLDLDSVDISGPNSTQVLVRNGFETNDNLDGGYDAGNLSYILYSDHDFVINGDHKVKGFVYAPGSTCTLNGNSYVVGGLVCEETTINGNPNDFTYDPSVENVDLRLDGDVTRLTYLHVTVNPVNVTSN